MRVLVVGGSGALGLPVVRALTAAGHDVSATSRSNRRSGATAAAGARIVIADLLDPTGLEQALTAAAPEVVVHAATALPPGGPRRWSQLAATNALRDRGTALLMAAAARHGVRRVVSQSFAGGYTPVEDPQARLRETAPFGQVAGAARGAAQAVRALAALERHTREGPVFGVALRFGFFYGDTAGNAALHHALRRRQLPLPGAASGTVSFVHVEDAAAAVVAAAEHAGAGAVYNVADEHPCRFGDYLRAVARAIGAPLPWTVPTAVAALAAPAAVEFVGRHRPLDSTRIRDELGWAPAHPNVLELAGATG